MTAVSDPKVIVALDSDDRKKMQRLVDQLDPQQCRLKVGKQMFTLFGPAWVEALAAKGFSVFLDLKFHDIPNTVAAACRAAAQLGVWMLNVHASGGPDMLMAAADSVKQCSGTSPLLIAVTVLTSMDQTQLQAIGVNADPAEQVLRLAKLTQQAGLDGVVCSGQESRLLRTALGEDFCLVTPGIRPAKAVVDDQTRIMTPVAALEAGSSYLVIGRPITAAADPQQALLDINRQIENNL